MSPRPVLAVDHDFPLTLTDSKYWPDAELQPLRSIHPDLIGGHEDWEILRELRVRGGIDGFVTLDRGMLSLPKEMVVLVQSRLTLIVIEDVHNDPLVATGLLMVYMPQIVKRFNPKKAQLWRIRPGDRTPQQPFDQLRKIAEQENTTALELLRANRLPSNTFLR